MRVIVAVLAVLASAIDRPGGVRLGREDVDYYSAPEETNR